LDQESQEKPKTYTRDCMQISDQKKKVEIKCTSRQIYSHLNICVILMKKTIWLFCFFILLGKANAYEYEVSVGTIFQNG
jgi:hypothetical protein